MASERQIRANRLNARKSTGPRTSDGKLASSQNAVRHGLTSLSIVLDGEDAALYESMRRELINEFKPSTVLDDALIQQLASVVWRLRRAAAYEPALLSWIAHRQSQMHDSQGITLGQTFLPINQMGLKQTHINDGTSEILALSSQHLKRTGRMLEAILDKNDLLGKLCRYETQLVRQMKTLLERLEN